MKIHYLQHVPFEDPGSILAWAKENGYTMTATRFYEKETPPPPSSFDWLIVMGGPMNVYEEEKYPWLAAEKRFIAEAIDSGKVVIGLCLGAQLLACILGGKVTKNPEKEIGWHSVTLSGEAKASALFSHFPDSPTVFQWHGDTFSLPPGATLLASSEPCANQAFSYKGRVFAFQFHLETTRGAIEALIEHCGDELTSAPFVQSADAIRSRANEVKKANDLLASFLSALDGACQRGLL